MEYSSSSSNGNMERMRTSEMLTEITFAHTQRWLKALKSTVIQNVKFAEVVEGITGVGPQELHGVGGNEEGLAFGRGKHPTIKTTVSNKEMENRGQSHPKRIYI